MPMLGQMFSSDQLIQKLLLLPALLFSLVIHEYAHARTALAFGDRTALYQGRLTLNPLAHLDPIGTLCILFASFGWARPVPVNPLNLYPRKLGDIAVSLAGPMSNLGVAVATALAIWLWARFAPRFVDARTVSIVTVYGIVLASINVMLFAFNLIPLFPLDGHHIVRELLPIDSQQGFMRWQLSFGRIGLLAMIFVPRFVPTMPDFIGIVFQLVSGVFWSVMPPIAG